MQDLISSSGKSGSCSPKGDSGEQRRKQSQKVYAVILSLARGLKKIKENETKKTALEPNLPTNAPKTCLVDLFDDLISDKTN